MGEANKTHHIMSAAPYAPLPQPAPTADEILEVRDLIDARVANFEREGEKWIAKEVGVEFFDALKQTRAIFDRILQAAPQAAPGMEEVRAVWQVAQAMWEKQNPGKNWDDHAVSAARHHYVVLADVAMTTLSRLSQPSEPGEGVGQAMQAAWDEICSDTGCHPLDITHEGRKLFFHPDHWAAATARLLRAAPLPHPQPDHFIRRRGAEPDENSPSLVAQPQPGAEQVCQHEPFEGRCVHCGVQFKDGAPALRPTQDVEAALREALRRYDDLPNRGGAHALAEAVRAILSAAAGTGE